MAATVGHLLVELLEEYGVGYVFGVPGGQTLPLYRAILEGSARSGAVRHILMRDERSAAYAADGYARLTGLTGVCDATVGPGVTNLVSGVAEAFSSSIPMVAIGSDIPRTWNHLRRRGAASQGIEQSPMFSTITKWLGRVETAASALDTIDAAFRIANVGRPGPVFLEIPDDVFASPATRDGAVERARPHRSPWYRPGADPAVAGEAARILAAARFPMIVAGGGVIASGAGEVVQQLSRVLSAPVATTMSGKGTIPESDPLAIGVAGSMGRPYANELVRRADAVLQVGTKAGQVGTLGWETPSPGAIAIHLDVDPEELGRNRRAIGLWADARLGVEAIIDALDGVAPASQWDRAELESARATWLASTREAPRANAPLRPQDLVAILSETLQPDDILVCDASLASGWGGVHFEVKSTGRLFLAPRGLAGLGWAAPAAIGAAVGAPGRRVAVLAGDGAWAYSMGEVETMTRLGLPILNVVLNNRTLAWAKHAERARFNGAGYLSVDFADVNYAAGAAGLGARASRISRLSEFRAAVETWDRGAATTAPTVIDVLTDEVDSPVLKFSSKGVGGYE